MKAEHRKELQTNALADRINRFFRGVKTKTQSTSTLFWVIVVLLVGAVIGGWWYFRWSSNRSRSAMWVAMDTAVGEKQFAEEEQGTKIPFHGGTDRLKKLQDAEDELTNIIDQHKGSKAALMARFQLAQLTLRSKGIDMLAERGKTPFALASIKEAQKQYEALADDCKDDPFWCPKALLGKALCVETLTLEDPKNLDRAIALYRELVDGHGDSAAGQEAAGRLKQLTSRSGRNRVEEFYSTLKEKLSLNK
jgi:hypothetical protein